MSGLLLATLAMMGLTFVIGFFVAAVIKIIANWADFLEVYHAYREQLVLPENVSEVQAKEVTPVALKVYHDWYREIVHKIGGIVHCLKGRRRVAA